MRNLILISAMMLAVARCCAQQPDILLADFEGKDYGSWKTTGEAFGPGPAQGTLPKQMEVSGYLGHGLVNSYFGGDKSIGTLTSPTFKIERKFITFLIGGGGWANETCMNSLVDGKVVRTATGPNTKPGGSEMLMPAAWDVTKFAGRAATIVIVDERKDGWGHINVDHIAQSDERGNIPLASKVEPTPPPAPERTRAVRIAGDFLQLPLMQHTSADKKYARVGLEKLSIEADGKLLRYMNVDLAKDSQRPDFWYSADMREFKGREVTLRIKSHDAAALDHLEFSDEEIIDPHAYDGPNRPRFHFSPRLGWMNDINGSYYQNGLYHIFYQFNPACIGTGAGFDMHWGHSVSQDLVHWEEWPVALFPNDAGQCYSGTTVLQQQPIPSLNEGNKLPAPAIFMAGTTPFSQHLATTSDGGRTWKRFAGNPVVPNMGNGDRDPKVIWHQASRHYVMVLYVGGKEAGYHFLRSKDLIHWEQTCVLPNWFECPEFIPMKSAITGEDLMLLYGCYRTPKDALEQINIKSGYQLGRFDGKTFTPITKLRSAHLGPNFYAALVFQNEPKDRPVMMGWAAGTQFPGEPFNQCASVPLLLQMKAINGEDTLCFEPAEELNTLRGKPLIKLSHATTAEANTKLATLAKDSPLDVVVRLRPAATVGLNLNLRNITFNYEPATKTLKRGSQATVLHPGASLDVRFLIDCGIVESFWNGGEAAYSIASLQTDIGPAFAIEGDAMIEELTVYPITNIWASREKR